MKTLALSDQISFLSTVSPVEGGAADGAAETHAATGRHDAFATILAESGGSAGKKSAAAPHQVAAALTASTGDQTAPAGLDLARPGMSGAVAAAMQSTLQDAAEAKTPAVAIGDQSAQPAAAKLLAGQETIAAQVLANGAGISASVEAAAPAETETKDAGKGDASATTEQASPGTDNAEAVLLAAGAFAPGGMLATLKAVSSDESSPAPAEMRGAAARMGETASASLFPTQSDPANASETTAAEGLAKPHATAHRASAIPSSAAISLGQDTTPPAQDDAPRTADAAASKTKERTAPADASGADKPWGVAATPAVEASRTQGNTPVESFAAMPSPQMAAAPQAQTSREPTPSVAGAAAADAARQIGKTVEPARPPVQAATGKLSASQNATEQAASAAVVPQDGATGDGVARQTAAADATNPLRPAPSQSVAQSEGTAQPSAADKTQKQAAIPQDVSVRLIQQWGAGAAPAPRESLAESRVRAALASLPASAAGETKAQPAAPTADTQSGDPAQASADESPDATATATPTAAQPKSASGVESATDKALAAPATAAQSAASVTQPTETQPRAARLRESKEVSSSKDRLDPGPQGAGAASDTAVKTADAAATPATEKVDSLSATSSGGPLSFGTAGTATTAERSAQLLGGDAGAATGTHRAASPHAIAHQMSQALADAGNRTVELTLSPEELGKVRMTLHSSDGAITVAVQAERPETLDLMRRNIESLARDFREMGYSNIGFDFGQQSDQRSSAQKQAAAETMPTQATPEREPVARFDTTSIALQSSTRTASGGLDLRI